MLFFTESLCVDAMTRAKEVIGIDDHAYFIHQGQEFMVRQTRPGCLEIECITHHHVAAQQSSSVLH